MEEPTPALLNYLKQQQPLRLLQHPENAPAVNDALAEIELFLAQREFRAGEADFEDLHWDYTRLFIGPEAPPAPPWESVYVSRDKLLFQQSTHQVKQYYENYGFTLPGSEIEAADHIGFEMDFLYHLSEQTVARLEAATDEDADFQALLHVQQTFLQRHLLAFVTPFSRNVYNHAQSGFYRALSTVLEHFAHQDAQRLARESGIQAQPA
ncbi:TorD/DmsD family molecular chaperone [Entomohabitans teleogrylli]|uniref:TorD/DmsD family molecular chaperone n=1 Tax=Entomohabitans teleogrylli TaxID=1384589 RepID=UPI0009E75F85|nr:molecular chaperone TorD family protein [Entomohabitans teleogrylli]